MEKWWFKNKDKKLMLFYVKDNQVITWEEGPDYPYEISLLRILCLGIGTDLYGAGKPFTEYKEFFIEGFHFEKVVE
ncbi:MAG: hypothetical protein E7167_01250 [Firmicutes bacterium]|nr:hypothetical protein [Bacillota bacterium]